MSNRIFSIGRIVLPLLFLGAALVQGAEAIGVAITSTNFVAPSPEKENLDQEWVEITNLDSASENLTGWTLSDAGNHTYTFLDFSLSAGAAVKVHTGSGTDSARDLYWNRNSSIWNNDGDEATLKDSSGNVVSSYSGEPGDA
jgi:hypothetical protein